MDRDTIGVSQSERFTECDASLVLLLRCRVSSPYLAVVKSISSVPIRTSATPGQGCCTYAEESQRRRPRSSDARHAKQAERHTEHFQIYASVNQTCLKFGELENRSGLSVQAEVLEGMNKLPAKALALISEGQSL